MQANPTRAAVDIVDGGPGNDLLDPGLNDAVAGGPDGWTRYACRFPAVRS